jgi:PAS domain S-box-containing protein
MNASLRILHLENDLADAELVHETLQADGIACELTRVEAEGEFRAALRQGGFDLILADYTLPAFDGLSALRIVRQQLADVPFIFVSGTLGEEVAIDALKMGATDYVFKTRLSRLVPATHRAMREARERVELRQREAKVRRLIDTNIVGVLISNLEGQVLDANDAVLNMVGYSRDDLTARRTRWTDWTPPEWRAVSERAVEQIRVHGKCDLFEKEYVRKDGSRVPVLIAAAAIEGTTNENVVFVLDLTERKRAEAAQTRAQAELEQARNALAHRQRVSLLGEVAASLAHEIKQPIAAATLDAHLCLRALGDDRLNLQSARVAASRMLEDAIWAEDIIARTSALYRKETTQRERVDVNAVIRHMALLLQQEAAASSVSIRTALADGLPEVIADRVQLQQVCMNLMLNAIEAMKGIGGDLTITSEVREPGELLISVSDQGVGLPIDSPGTIFDAFVTTKPQGTGMGLAITRSIVDAHGGRVWASANTGPGATFFFTLVADAAEPPPSRSL